MANRNTIRRMVKSGEIFSVRKDGGSGRTGGKSYAALGTNGKYASVNLDNGAISFTPIGRGDKRVKVTGTYNVEATFVADNDKSKAKRSMTVQGDLFTINKGSNIYMHLGKNREGKYVSLNLRSHDYALGGGGGNVTIIGFAELAVAK